MASIKLTYPFQGSINIGDSSRIVVGTTSSSSPIQVKDCIKFNGTLQILIGADKKEGDSGIVKVCFLFFLAVYEGVTLFLA